MARKLVDKVLGFMGFEEEPVEEEEKEHFREEDPVPQVKRKGQVFSLHTQRQVRVIVAEPRVFEDVQAIADHLKNRRPVVVNLERAESDLARRIVDFISGATYALNGSMQKVGNGIFLFVPSNMDIAGNIKEYGERGIFPWKDE
ncbi:MULTISPECIES: cell division protein SepF [Desulfofundulus]|jgi:cell division inhibitor SepF|uniref:Cell division protein SepF n=1 Tax=Desulfofundulus australicus DSM 11792 TaxID=1121425 RepID=A0A1M5A0P3_9FIRM|nr:MULTISPECIES: cell division protein SepF [Desulfofundulus]MBE3584800.1 cell division protein SepF [Thermoanaerobacter sp.]MCS5694700.1 cell division protein SepF [Desulfofundulus thermocisternus]MDK2887655.1 cell division inhibitor SepF [Thermoanaerobacter sp.]SHF23873.1 cell division inhibitor SepF [Desulfofundulus australicus DSM 11792]